MYRVLGVTVEVGGEGRFVISVQGEAAVVSVGHIPLEGSSLVVEVCDVHVSAGGAGVRCVIQ